MSYIPEASHIVVIDIQPYAEQRAVVVISPASYNDRSGFMICCPITTEIKGYPFEVLIAGNIPNIALSDQIKSLDWRARNARKIGSASAEEMAEIRGKIRALTSGGGRG